MVYATEYKLKQSSWFKVLAQVAVSVSHSVIWLTKTGHKEATLNFKETAKRKLLVENEQKIGKGFKKIHFF